MLENTIGVIGIRKLKIQQTLQCPNDKGQHDNALHTKLNIEQCEPRLNRW
jgi:hypothetical protein